MRRGAPILVVALCAAALHGCSGPPATGPAPRQEPFEEWSPGLGFVHANGMTGEFYIIEVIGSGGALFDYDDDGDLDIYLVQGGSIDPTDGSGGGDRDRLLRNDLELDAEGRPRLAFTDVTEASGIPAGGYGMGVATGDYDNDGRIDLYVTNFGSNRLLRNNGDGTFRDVTRASGADDPRWSVPAVFFDYDRDGWLDLFVANYVDFTFSKHKRCQVDQGFRDYCGPLTYRAEPDRLLRNRGDGSFEDVTAQAGLRAAYGNGLGAVPVDIDDDGWDDLYVANDWTENQLWINRGDGTFEDRALLSGCAVNAEGQPEASMGLVAEDLDGDADVDLFMTHLASETNTLYVNDGTGSFRDATIDRGLAEPSLSMTGFGVAALDFDNDADLDLIAVNGAVRLLIDLLQAGDPYPLHQQNQLFRNRGDGSFEDVSDLAGRPFERSEVSRGLAVGDVDNDGDPDVLVTNNNGPARLLLNRGRADGHWVGLRLVGGAPPRDLLGSRVTIVDASGRAHRRTVRTAGSYASAGDPRILVGLGDTSELERIVVQWPGGTQEVWSDVKADRYTTLVRGTGKPAEAR